MHTQKYIDKTNAWKCRQFLPFLQREESFAAGSNKNDRKNQKAYCLTICVQHWFIFLINCLVLSSIKHHLLILAIHSIPRDYVKVFGTLQQFLHFVSSPFFVHHCSLPGVVVVVLRVPLTFNQSIRFIYKHIDHRITNRKNKKN